MAELDQIRDVVRERYAGAARSVGDGKPGCCGPSESSCGCGTDVPDACGDAGFGTGLYSSEERDALPDAADHAAGALDG